MTSSRKLEEENCTADVGSRRPRIYLGVQDTDGFKAEVQVSDVL
jgi:hypothetical protein